MHYMLCRITVVTEKRFLIRNASNAFWIIVGARFHFTITFGMWYSMRGHVILDERPRELDWKVVTSKMLVKKPFVSCRYLALVYWHNTYISLLFWRQSTGQILDLGFLLVLPLSHSQIVKYSYWSKNWLLNLRSIYWTEQSTLEIQNRNRNFQVSNICWPTLEIFEQAG